MALTYTLFNIKTYEENSLPIQAAPDVLTPLASPYTNLSIGERKLLTFRFTAGSATELDGFDLFFVPRLFGSTGVIPTSYLYGYRSRVPSVGIKNVIPVAAGGQEPRNTNFICTFERISSTVVEITLLFYLTTDLKNYILNTFLNSELRFKSSSIANAAGTLDNSVASVYNLQSKSLDLFARIIDTADNFSLNNQNVKTAAGDDVAVLNMQGRFYNQDLNGIGIGRKYVEKITIGVPFLSGSIIGDIDGVQNNNLGKVDDFYTINDGKNLLSTYETNEIEFVLRGFANGDPAPLTPAFVRWALIRTDNIASNVNFLQDHELGAGSFTGVDLSVGVPLYTPVIGEPVLKDYFVTPYQLQSGGGFPDRIETSVTIKPDELVFGATYRIILNVYYNDGATVTAHISPELKTLYTPPAEPLIEATLFDYINEFIGNEIDDVAPHDRIKGRLTIDKASYAADVLALSGVASADFDTNFVQALVTYSGAALGIPSQNGNYVNGGTGTGIVVVSDTPAELVLEFTVRIDEERQNTSTPLEWKLRFSQPTPDPSFFQTVEIIVQQRLNVGQFEETKLFPVMLEATRVLDPSVYPAQKIEVTNLSSFSQVLIEVEKDVGTLEHNLLALIYPAQAGGFTSLTALEERESFASPEGLPQLTTSKLSAVEVDFGGDEFATFLVNVDELVFEQLYYLTAIAKDNVTDPSAALSYCPVISPSIGNYYETTRTGAKWMCRTFAVDMFNALTVAALLPPVIVHNQVINELTGDFTGITPFLFPNPNTAGAQLNVDVDTGVLQIRWVIRIQSQHNGATGVHTLEHEINVLIDRPAIVGGGWSSTVVGFTCTDLTVPV